MTALFRNSYQRGFFTVFFSSGSSPLRLWETHIKDGYITRFLDPELKTLVVDLLSNNISTTYMVCPKGRDTLGIHMPFMILIVKNLKKYWSFEVTVRDDSGMKRRFRVANFQSTTSINPCSTVMPIGLSEGWNQIQFNLADFTRRAYNRSFAEVVSIKVNANIRLRRIYFADTLVPEDELPNEYRLFIPLSKAIKEKKVEDERPSQEGKRTSKEEKRISEIKEKDFETTVAPSKQPSDHAAKGSVKHKESKASSAASSKTDTASVHSLKSLSKALSAYTQRENGTSRQGMKSASKTASMHKGSSHHEIKSASKAPSVHVEKEEGPSISTQKEELASLHEVKSPSKSTSHTQKEESASNQEMKSPVSAHTLREEKASYHGIKTGSKTESRHSEKADKGLFYHEIKFAAKASSVHIEKEEEPSIHTQKEELREIKSPSKASSHTLKEEIAPNQKIKSHVSAHTLREEVAFYHEMKSRSKTDSRHSEKVLSHHTMKSASKASSVYVEK